jgi:hypothetical protein
VSTTRGDLIGVIASFSLFSPPFFFISLWFLLRACLVPSEMFSGRRSKTDYLSRNFKKFEMESASKSGQGEKESDVWSN